MPHVVVKHWPGPTEEQKAELTARLVQAVRDVFGSSEASLSVALEEVAPAAWTEAVWRAEIEPKLDSLYKKPGYTPS